eukprot:s3650_g2.t1
MLDDAPIVRHDEGRDCGLQSKKIVDSKVKIDFLHPEHHQCKSVPRSCGRAVIRPILRCEQRRRLRQRSIVVQGALTFLAFGWLLALCGLFSRCLHALCRGKAGRRRVSKPEGGASSRPKYRCCPGLRRLLERCYVWRAFLYWTGLGGRSGYGGDDSKVVDAAKRSAGGGARTLEETLAQFGLDTVEQQTFHGALQSLLTDGYEEITQEAGWTGAEIEVQIPERDLELEEEDNWRPSACVSAAGAFRVMLACTRCALAMP